MENTKKQQQQPTNRKKIKKSAMTGLFSDTQSECTGSIMGTSVILTALQLAAVRA